MRARGRSPPADRPRPRRSTRPPGFQGSEETLALLAVQIQEQAGLPGCRLADRRSRPVCPRHRRGILHRGLRLDAELLCETDQVVASTSRSQIADVVYLERDPVACRIPEGHDERCGV
eukprot:CAMPEP_0183451936 /NCGR_PEP_ID=MMETSP0370-20130417/116573_1 /TAXON_ID=268820 /ORGANISM="Peridinium aciculiferum, Strain PAER-2" /LENGTH=117 /DNA_ID=CAMNT_0025643199 /DNA_START=387 /DNA_END=741 /DNA_ORIENTATION=-